MGRVDGSYGKRLREFSRVDVLIVDDWAMTPLDDSARRAFLEICDERYRERSTMLTSQLPVSICHAQIGDPTIADRIRDRLVHNAYRIPFGVLMAGVFLWSVRPALRTVWGFARLPYFSTHL